jgi:hypothetical protein
VAAFVGLVLTSSSSASTDGRFHNGPAGKNIILPLRQGVFVGAASAPASATTNPNLAPLEAMLGRRLDIEHRYMQERCSLDRGVIRGAGRRGHIPMISWTPSPSVGEMILRGAADACIFRIGKQLGRQPYRLFLRPYWEFNGSWSPYTKHVDGSPLSADEHRGLWRRTVDILRAAGAFKRASIVWCPSEGHYGNNDFFDERRAYPGDRYVDWVCADGFNRNSPMTWCGAHGTSHSGWCEFREIFHDSSLPSGSVESDFRGRKPFMVGETGSVEGTPGSKGEWFRNARAYIKEAMPGLRALVLFDAALSDGDWRVGTTASSVQGVRELVRDPYFDSKIKHTTSPTTR